MKNAIENIKKGFTALNNRACRFRFRNKPESPSPGDLAATAIGAPVPSLSRVLKGWHLLGWGLITVFCGGALFWSATTELDGAAIAQGVVAVESNRKSIQHLEGGIIKEIHVADGSEVKAGKVLLVLDDIGARAALDLLNSQYHAALALQARLVAERDGSKEITFPSRLASRAEDPEIGALIRTQEDALKFHRAFIRAQENQLAKRVEALQVKIEGFKGQLEANREALGLFREELGDLEGVVESGVVARSSYMSVQRNASEVVGKIAEYGAAIAETRKTIAETRAQMAMPAAKNLSEVGDLLLKVQERLGILQEKTHAAEDVLERTRIRAPQSGTVVDLQVHTPGGVIGPGQHLMDLVPDNDRLVIDARVDPREMDVVYKGMPARVMLTAFNARTTPAMTGVVTAISADQLTDQITGQPYFSARVVHDGGSQGFDVAKLMPGMQAEVFLITNERTVLDYFIEPISRSLARAGREQ